MRDMANLYRIKHVVIHLMALLAQISIFLDPMSVGVTSMAWGISSPGS
jgi:hypothetical protein